MINLFSSMGWYLTTCLDMQFICVSYDMKNDGHVFMSQNQQCTYSITLLLLLLTVTVTQKGVRFFLFSLEQMILFYQHPDQLCTWYKLDICVLNNTYMVEVI